MSRALYLSRFPRPGKTVISSKSAIGVRIFVGFMVWISV